MLDTVGNVVEDHNGNLKVTRNGREMLLQRLRKNITQVQEIRDISSVPPAMRPAPSATDSTRLLLAIDHRETAPRDGAAVAAEKPPLNSVYPRNLSF